MCTPNERVMKESCFSLKKKKNHCQSRVNGQNMALSTLFLQFVNSNITLWAIERFKCVCVCLK